MNTKASDFTHGPWHVEPYQRDEGASLCVVAPNNGWIVCIIPPDEDEGRLPPDGPNASLISAAPDLYECVRGFVEAWGEDVAKDRLMNGGDVVEWVSGAMLEFKAALAKAERKA